MTITIDLSPAVEQDLREAAADRGIEPAALLENLLSRELRQESLKRLKGRKVAQSITDLKPRRPTPEGSTPLAEVVGKWPGTESDEEIRKALNELS